MSRSIVAISPDWSGRTGGRSLATHIVPGRIVRFVAGPTSALACSVDGVRVGIERTHVGGRTHSGRRRTSRRSRSSILGENLAGVGIDPGDLPAVELAGQRIRPRESVGLPSRARSGGGRGAFGGDQALRAPMWRADGDLLPISRYSSMSPVADGTVARGGGGLAVGERRVCCGVEATTSASATGAPPGRRGQRRSSDRRWRHAPGRSRP